MPVTKRKSVDMNAPVWFDGTNINEALFCDEFLSSRKIIFANGAFFTPDGRVTDDLPLRGEIYEELKCCAVNNIPRKITNILEVMKLAAHVEDFAPETDKIHLANGTLTLDGNFTEGRPDIVRSRLPVAYRPDAPAPALWLSFLDGLLYAEDIPTFIWFLLISCLITEQQCPVSNRAYSLVLEQVRQFIYNQFHPLIIAVILHIREHIFQETKIYRHIIIFNLIYHKFNGLEQLFIIRNFFSMTQTNLL